MTEAIIITAIIVGGVVALAALLLNSGFKAWSAERDREAVIAAAKAKQPIFNIKTDATPQEAERAAREYRLVDPFLN